MKKGLALIALLAFFGQLPYQKRIQDKVYLWEIDQWNKGGAWKRWLIWREKWIGDI